MRVLHVIKATRIAGAESHLLILLGGLAARGIDARMLVLVEPGTPMDDYCALLAERGVPAETLVIHRHADPALLPRLWRRFRALKPDVVHTHLLHADLYGLPAARLARVPVVITGRHAANAFRQRWPLRLVNAVWWRLATAGVASSDHVARYMIAVEAAPADRLHTIHYGLEIPDPLDRPAARAALRGELGLPAEAPIIGMVCRLVWEKDIPNALLAFERVGRAFPEAHLVIAGDGPLRAELEAQAAALDAAARVHFLGWRAESAPIFAALDVLFMPSLTEGFGMSLLEAMAQHLPIVSSNVSAIPEVVADGETGLLCPPRAVEALAVALGTLLDEPALRARMGQAGRRRLEVSFSAGRLVDETIALYRSFQRSDRAG